MKILKPAWVNHDGLPIFSIDVHPDSSRFATGGQGTNSAGRISIWNMAPVLDEDKRNNENVPKLLCELEFHACVNAVRWSHHGKYLSSAGDDKAIEIWKCASKYNGAPVAPTNNPFNKAGHEQWKSVAMLHGHSGDVLDVSWSPNNKYLASASVDNTVIIWDAVNFPHIITTLKGHTSLVKGVTWDPVGKFVASQSDDKTLRIWRTADWQLEHTVKEPFLECGGTTHVLRLDWSPDGLYLVSAHAMNAGGPTAQIVERTGWKTDKDFVGHRKAVVCVRFNPNILQKEVGSKNKTCCVALGSRDRSVSIWSAALKRPVVVLNDLFTSSVMDLSWSTCGSILLCCSFDGTVGTVQFSTAEIGKPIAPSEVTLLHQQTYGTNVLTPSLDIIHDVSLLKANKTSHRHHHHHHHHKKNSTDNAVPSSKVPDNSSSANTINNSNVNNIKPEKQTNGLNSNTSNTINNTAVISTKQSTPSTAGNNNDNMNSTNISNNNNETETKIDEKMKEETLKSEPMDTTTTAATTTTTKSSSSSSPSSTSPIKGPLYKQIETVRNDGKRRITPQFLLPQGNSQSSHEENNLTNIGNQIDNDANKNNTSKDTSAPSSSTNNANNLESSSVTLEQDNKAPQQQKQQENAANNDVIMINSSGNVEDDPSKNKTLNKLDRAALLEARVSETGNAAPAVTTTNGEPALITKSRVSTGSGSTSDTSTRSSKDKEKDQKEKDKSVSAKEEPNVSQKDHTNTINTISVQKRKRSVDEPEQGVKSSKKGKNGPISLSSSSTVAQTNSGVNSTNNNNNQNVVNINQQSSTTSKNIVQLTSSKQKQNAPLFPTPAPSNAQSGSGTASASHSAAKAGTRHKLQSMKLPENFTEIQVTSKATGGYVLEVNNNVERSSWNYQIHCRHQKTSLDGLSWTLTMDSPIVGVTGDSARIVVICENGLCHILYTNGRYNSVPFALPNFPHRMVHTGQYLMIISVKATVHVWNLATKKNVIRCESLLPILNDPGKVSPEITHCAILVGGVPLIVLSNGKSFKFNFDYQSWVLFVNIATSSHATLSLVGNKPCPEDDEFLSNSNRMSAANSRHVDYQLLSQIKMKLTASIEMKKAEEVRTWMTLLGITLAKEGLESELRALCLDLLGPCHSAANFPTQTNSQNHNTNSGTATSSSHQQQQMWNPCVVGIPKRNILRQLLQELAKNLRWQGVFTEFNTLLNIAENSENACNLMDSNVLI